MGVRSTRTFDVPHEPGETITVKLLSANQVRELKAKGSQAKRLAGEEKDEAMGWELIGEVCREAIVAWSFREEDGEPIPVSPENIDDLDAKTSRWVFDTLMVKEPDEQKKDD